MNPNKQLGDCGGMNNGPTKMSTSQCLEAVNVTLYSKRHLAEIEGSEREEDPG